MYLFLTLISLGLHAQAPSLPILDFSSFQPYLQKDNDTIYVVNFWATWCRPCVEELPLLERLHADLLDQPHQVILVSLDFRDQVESKLVPFIKQHDIKSKVVVLDDPNANTWIDQVDRRWSGALPATIVYRGTKRLFFADAFDDYASLRSVIDGF